LGWVDTLRDCAPGNNTEIAVRGRASAVISGYVNLYSAIPFRVENNNIQLFESLNTLFSETISRNFPSYFKWCYIKSDKHWLKVNVPFRSDPNAKASFPSSQVREVRSGPNKTTIVQLKTQTLVLPLGIFNRYLHDQRLCDMSTDDISDIICSISNLFDIMMTHSHALNDNIELANNVKCWYINYANTCIETGNEQDINNIYGDNVNIKIDDRFIELAEQHARTRPTYECHVECYSDDSDTDSDSDTDTDTDTDSSEGY